MKYLVRSGGLLGFPELVEAFGQSPMLLLEEAGLPLTALRDPDFYLSYVSVAKLLVVAARSCKSPDFGLQLGSHQGLEVLGAMAAWMCLQAHVGDALLLMEKSIGFHARGIKTDVEASTKLVVMDMHFEFSSQTDTSQLLALSMVLLARCVAQLHGTPLLPVQVSLTLPVPRDARRWQNAFAVMPQFGAEVNRLVYPPQLLSLPVHIDQVLRERLSKQWRVEWQQLRQHQPASLQQQVERAIVALLPSGDCALEKVAQLVELSPRTLQAKLKQEGLSFGALLRKVRERLAHEHLLHSDMDLTSLAMNLGFSELAVFSRTFKSWTGISPRQWRGQQAHQLQIT